MFRLYVVHCNEEMYSIDINANESSIEIPLCAVITFHLSLIRLRWEKKVFFYLARRCLSCQWLMIFPPPTAIDPVRFQYYITFGFEMAMFERLSEWTNEQDVIQFLNLMVIYTSLAFTHHIFAFRFSNSLCSARQNH